ncbi:MAG: tricarballylate utilization 4Fe-4S protein TcuB [Burkholderiaceae bacterium]|nr:tricarballylate utilization 4Fe-4S protein TcuB [Burkholderiaceae bacterium]MCU0963524.1 tricarballylate utilization 4Fe-4S protein TcuB [Burkholderiaceae bacterium]
MLPLDALIRDAEAEASRVLQICNACRYCEGFCAVFPAMTRRLEFPKADIHYLSNLCHNCGACLHACQYAPPHEFAVNVPKALAQVRGTTYADYAWPQAFGRLYQRAGLTVALALAFGLALFLVLALVLNGTLWPPPMAGNFYAVFPHNLMVGLFGPVFVFACLALGLGVARFWRDVSPGDASAAAAGEALRNVLQLKYLDGGHGQGCNDADDRFTLWRRRFHHATFYGFALCFAATCVATLYHYAFGWQAPYPLTSVPVLLGTAGGIGLLVGPLGLGWLHLKRHPLHGDAAQKAMDHGLIALLFFTSLTGLGLLAWRDTSAMALWLAVHLGCVMALFLTMPYGKFAHGVYRSAALLKWAIERRQPTNLKLGSE